MKREKKNKRKTKKEIVKDNKEFVIARDGQKVTNENTNLIGPFVAFIDVLCVYVFVFLLCICTALCSHLFMYFHSDRSIY